MTKDSESHVDPQAILHRLREMLDERLVQTQIDAPIDRVAGAFQAAIPSPPTVRAVHDAMAGLVQVVYARALRCSLQLTGPEALAEAMGLLDEGYRSPQVGQGYEDAMVDAVTEGAMGVSFVLGAVIGIIKVRERMKWRRWVIVDCLEAIEPAAFARIAQAIRDEVSAFVPLGTPSLPSTFYSGEHIVKAIEEGRRSDRILQGILDSAGEPCQM